MTGGIAQAKKSAEDRFDAIAKAAAETVERFIEDKKKELLSSIEETVKLQRELPGFDLSRYDMVEKFSVANPTGTTSVETLRVGAYATKVNVVLRPGEGYECYFLMRKKEALDK